MSDSIILKGLMFLGDKLLSNIQWIAKAKRDQRDRIADYCHSIADCLSKAYKDLHQGQIPHGCCAEMDSYMRDLRDMLEKTLTPAEFKELRDSLEIAYHVERLGHELSQPEYPDSKFAELDIAAGKFRAVANKIRV